MHKRLVISAITMSIALAKIAYASPVEFSGSGAAPAGIQAVVDGFRAALGANNGIGGTFDGGRREINWDGIPDAFSAPNLMPPNFFNANSKRGAVFFTPGSGFQVSAKSGSGTPTQFGNIAPNLPHDFLAFSPQRLFTALDSNITEVVFFIPGTNIPASVDSFGSVFTNVRHFGATKIDYFGANGVLLHSQVVPPSSANHQGLSFAGTKFDNGERVFLVRVTSGNVDFSATTGTHPNAANGDPVDFVVMDDFIYGEPQSLVE